MKLIVVVFGLLVVFGASSASSFDSGRGLRGDPIKQRIFENVINGTINAASRFLGRFDPIRKENVDISFPLHTLKVDRVIVENFSKFHAPTIKLNGLLEWRFEFVLRAKGVNAVVDNYQIDGLVIWGTGDVHLLVDTVTVSIDAKVSIPNIQDSYVNCKKEIKDTEVALTGFYDDEELSRDISVFVTDVITGNVSGFDEVINRLIVLLMWIVDKIIG